jgi:glycosyltransferase involved in cell wall biosynthesis
MKKVLIMANVDPNTSPRPNRMIHWLKDRYNVTVVARQEAHIDGVANSFVIKPTGLYGTLNKEKSFLYRLKEFLSRLLMFLRRDYEGMIWASMSKPYELRDRLAAEGFDLIISHDCTLLPLAFSIKGKSNARIMMDARDYYPLNFDDQFLWRIFVKPLNKYLCSTYLSCCDKVTTVSESFARKYKDVYHVDPEVILSLPRSYKLSPTPVRDGGIRIIHHGYANPSRKIELMIEMMDHVDSRFSLDLMMVGSGRYFEKLHKMVEHRKNVRFISPVPMPDIIPVSNQYDIGLFLMAPTNFNLKFTVPNKFFEFIQARLVLAISPSVEMKKLLEKYDCGVVADDFTPQSLARALNSLVSNEAIMDFKKKSHQAALELNAEVNEIRVLQIVRELLNEAG